MICAASKVVFGEVEVKCHLADGHAEPHIAYQPKERREIRWAGAGYQIFLNEDRRSA